MHKLAAKAWGRRELVSAILDNGAMAQAETRDQTIPPELTPEAWRQMA
jgi:hypothetical protein